MKTTTLFSDKVKVLHIMHLKPSKYGTPRSIYIMQRIETPEQEANLSTFEVSNPAHSFEFINIEKGDILYIEYKRKNKTSWDFILQSYKLI